MNLTERGKILEEVVVGLVALNDGELVGRTRLQKQAYLLNRCGAEFPLKFNYYHYGPYSSDLVEGLTDARANHRVTVEEKPGRHRVHYSIFRSVESAPDPFGNLTARTARNFLRQMQNVSDIVLEIAATIIFLRDEWYYYGKGKISEVEETKVRKPLKATDERIEKAITLLRDLGLWEPAAATAARRSLSSPPQTASAKAG